MKVVEIFKSIEGEGIRAGYPATFIRLHGCNLHCSYCDSQYACVGKEFKEMTLNQIYGAVEAFGLNRITITGGEPLIHPNIENLVKGLLERDYDVNIETNGSVPLERYYGHFGLMFTMDWKCPSSGMHDKMWEANLDYLDYQDVLKFVVGSAEDLDVMAALIKEQELRCQVFVSPVFGKIEPKDIVQYLLDNKMENVRMQLQLHKFIWDPQMRGV